MSERTLMDEEQLAIFWQRPHLVVNHQFQFINVVANLVEIRSNAVVISDGSFTHICDTVGFLSSFHHLVDHPCNSAYMTGNLANQPFWLGSDFDVFAFAES